VNSTPTFIIGNKSYPGALPYDVIKAIVDSAAKKPAPADSAAKKPAAQ
jgi:predicted DsbA family dithiol-disulfide isomerase